MEVRHFKASETSTIINYIIYINVQHLLHYLLGLYCFLTETGLFQHVNKSYTYVSAYCPCTRIINKNLSFLYGTSISWASGEGGSRGTVAPLKNQKFQ